MTVFSYYIDSSCKDGGTNLFSTSTVNSTSFSAKAQNHISVIQKHCSKLLGVLSRPIFYDC